MNVNSLSFRLMLSAAAWTIIILSGTAAILISLSRGLIEDNFDQHLNQYLEYLIAQSIPQHGVELKRPDNLGDVEFSTPLSGSYWQIRPAGAGAEPLFKSESLLGETFKTPSDVGVSPDARHMRQAYVEGPDGQILRVIERDITFSQGDDTKVYSFSVAADSDEVNDQVRGFTNSIVLTLSLLGIGLLIATFFQVRFGLGPLRDLGIKLAAIRSGQETKLDGPLPAEIAPLQHELNALIEANARIVERARTHVGNLAHALKTPLSVIMNEASGQQGEFAGKIAEQAEIMRSQISHHLGRARIAAQIRTVSGVTNVTEELGAISRALAKIYQERGITLSIESPSNLMFSGESQDFAEMAGNLMDNACKWARSRVKVRARLLSSPALGQEKRLEIVIEDDGPGLPEEFRHSAVRRGRRLDESVPGSGLGLSIVADLSHLYRGVLSLDASALGGVAAKLVLPAA